VRGSTDGTAEAARAAAHGIGAADRVTVLAGQPLPAGWTGKLWAMAQGVAHARSRPTASRLLLFTDADIEYEPGALDAVVARGEAGELALVSVMVQLRCVSLAERYLVPAFVYFFAMLYPFAWVNDPNRRTAAAAGGCMLVRPEALDRAGGIAAIRGALIDDVAMGGALKQHGPVWLGLSRRIHSIRPYPTVADFGDMVARTAYTQLRYSPVLLAGTFLGMGLTYLAAPLAALFAPGAAGWIGLTVWLAMIASFIPISQQYGRPWLQGALLPLVAAWYCVFTWQSFWRYATGQGGRWKGRVQAPPSGRS
jgi:hopene-associated glycosyltransferase HpnB